MKIYFPLTVGCDMKKEIDMVKKKIYNDLVINRQETVYDPDRFREFCISAGATKLFDTILGCITSFRHSADHTCLNKKRVVSFIYNLCYCLSQTCNPLQIDHALYLRSNQINQEGIESEHIMGHIPLPGELLTMLWTQCLYLLISDLSKISLRRQQNTSGW